jgi:hypothetical protein
MFLEERAVAEANLDSELRELVFRFFYRFSRFEFALKEANFLRSRIARHRAEPDWVCFIGKYEKNYQLSNAAKALIEANPEQQVVGDDGQHLDFKTVERDQEATDMAYVVALARTVRNNLFHGGKHDSEGWDDPVRIRKLVELSTTVLDELADRAGLNSDYTGLY